MKTVIHFDNKLIPVYFSSENKQPMQRTLKLLTNALDHKIRNGKQALKKCLTSLISIEIEGSEAILHSKSEFDSLALSLY
ncbi:hypothetical protein AWM70_05510 [Paenibacillus yonginensis]|uniref:Uncharacterized protein n=2 Tax=Paenibacillus TaxID=44249 RepID=A0A1B1MY74_9BACL|nr:MULTISPECIES: hypothetical protein [Paenibacillus]ANS74099.1 hypothetical protein AWM70_05510 [Paenibacillus yonginensis]GGA38886.1 hypothetical protein GCM10010917_25160 [Paenibacillus physcomitrellae]